MLKIFFAYFQTVISSCLVIIVLLHFYISEFFNFSLYCNKKPSLSTIFFRQEVTFQKFCLFLCLIILLNFVYFFRFNYFFFTFYCCVIDIYHKKSEKVYFSHLPKNTCHKLIYWETTKKKDTHCKFEDKNLKNN